MDRFEGFSADERAVLGAALYLALAMKVWAVGRGNAAGPGVVEHVLVQRELLREVASGG